MPAELSDVIRYGRMILSWYEHLPEDDMPPKWMWVLDDELEHHFEKVKARREARFGGSGQRDLDDDDALVVRNEYARGRGKG